MKKLDYASLVLGILSLVWMLAAAGQFSAATPPSVSLVTTPVLSEVIPAHTPAQLHLVAQNVQGRPLQGNLGGALQAPQPNPWLTRDFPWVEGTTGL